MGLFCYNPLSQCSTSNSFVVGSFTGPACAHGDGATANPAPCVCGASGACTSATGLFCDATKNQCDDVPYCATTDGTAANEANCACGTTDCDAATTGLFCDASNNQCDDVPYCVSGEVLTASGTCVLTIDGASDQELKDAYNSRNTCDS